MRRERRDVPLISKETKEEARKIQIDLAEEKALKIAMTRLADDTISAWQRLYSAYEAGEETGSPVFRNVHKDDIDKASPILQAMLTGGYLKKSFGTLRSHTATVETKSSFSLYEIQGNSDGLSHDESRPFIEMFQDCQKAWDIVNSWNPVEGASFFLEAVQDKRNPQYLPLLKRDLAARTGGLHDFKGFLGAARLVIPTTIYGVKIEHDYESAESEFPDLRVLVSKLS